MRTFLVKLVRSICQSSIRIEVVAEDFEQAMNKALEEMPGWTYDSSKAL